MKDFSRRRPFSEVLEEEQSNMIERRKERSERPKNTNEIDSKGNIVVLFENDKRWDQTFDENNKILSKRCGDEYYVWDYDETGELISESYKIDPATKPTTKKYSKIKNNTRIEYFTGNKKHGSTTFNCNGQILIWTSTRESILFTYDDSGNLIKSNYCEITSPYKKTNIEYLYPKSYKYHVVEIIKSSNAIEIYYLEKTFSLLGVYKFKVDDVYDAYKKFNEMKLASEHSHIIEHSEDSLLKGERLKHESFFWEKKMVQINESSNIFSKIKSLDSLGKKYDEYEYNFIKETF